jgi:hypothetical protein
MDAAKSKCTYAGCMLLHDRLKYNYFMGVDVHLRQLGYVTCCDYDNLAAVVAL